VTSAADRRPRRLDVMHWLAADGQPGWPGETPGALTAELNLSEHAILLDRNVTDSSFSALTTAHSSTSVVILYPCGIPNTEN